MAGKSSLDHDVIEKLASIHCTNTEIAAVIGCDNSLLSKEPYSTIIAKGKERGKMTLRRKMFETAMGGNVTMQIWMSKQILGMTEKTVQTITQTNINGDPERIAQLVETIKMGLKRE